MQVITGSEALEITVKGRETLRPQRSRNEVWDKPSQFA